VLKPMQAISLFTGIGGFEIAFNQVFGNEAQVIQSVEIDPDAQQVLRSHFPNTPIHPDIRTYNPDVNWNFTDGIIFGGFPCSGTSAAGDRTGLEHPESILWWEMYRIIGTTKPRFILIENPEGLRHRGLGTIIKSLTEIGYVGEWQCVSAADLGAPHQRERLFIIAYPECLFTQKQPPCWADQVRAVVQIQQSISSFPAFEQRDDGVAIGFPAELDSVPISVPEVHRGESAAAISMGDPLSLPVLRSHFKESSFSMSGKMPNLEAQRIFNRFRNELGGFTSAIELSESQAELIEEIGACYYHIRKDEQVTIRKIAVLSEHQNQGWGRLLVYRVICRAIEEKKANVFLKCPENLPSNNFYKKLGFELEATESGKNQPINHWRYHIKLPLLFYCGGGGKSKYDAIALTSGWSSGINSKGKNKAHQHMMMVDNDWKNYSHAQHIEMVRQNKPLIATARDIEHPEQLPEILEQAAELAQYAGRVLLIPKCDVQIPEKYWLGYSVDSGYGSTPLKPDWFGSRPVHLLGGSPKKQALLYPQMNVVSLDANYAQNLATNYCKAVWSDGKKNIEQREQDCYQALALSLSKQFEFWRNRSFPTPETKPANKESDKWYTPPNIENLVTQVLGAIDLDPCADDGKHIAAAHHYTAADDGLSQEWQGRVFMNPPYSCPGKWIAKLQAEYESGRVTEAIALVPAATDTNWLSPLLDSQLVCFWKGRIKFLDTDYQPKQSARQSHCLVYWGDNKQKFKKVFDEVGIVKNVDSWNPADFGDLPYKADSAALASPRASGDQLTIFCDYNEPPEPDDYPNTPAYEQAWAEWELKNNQPKDKTMTFQFSGTQAIAEQISQLQEQLNQLTATLKPYQECEQKAEELRLQVAEYGNEMATKGISQDDILTWGNALYSAASGTEFIDNNSSVIAAQNQVIAELKTELAATGKREERTLADAARERDEALDKITNMTEDKLQIARRLQTTQDRHAQVLEELKNLKEQTATTDENTISEQIIDILKVNPKLSGNQIIEALGMDKEERGIYTHLNRLVDKGIVFCDADPLDKRRKLYSLHDARGLVGVASRREEAPLSENNTQHDTQHSENNTQHDTSKDSVDITKFTVGVACFSVGDRVAVVDVGEEDNLEYLLGNKGTVVGVKGDSVAVLFEKRLEFDEHEVVLSSRYLSCPHLQSIPHPDIAAQAKH
jgi:DNA (cytosine-5)-methyltransferase 1